MRKATRRFGFRGGIHMYQKRHTRRQEIKDFKWLARLRGWRDKEWWK